MNLRKSTKIRCKGVSFTTSILPEDVPLFCACRWFCFYITATPTLISQYSSFPKPNNQKRGSCFQLIRKSIFLGEELLYSKLDSKQTGTTGVIIYHLALRLKRERLLYSMSQSLGKSRGRLFYFFLIPQSWELVGNFLFYTNF